VSVKGLSVLVHLPSGSTKLPSVGDYGQVTVTIGAPIAATGTTLPLPAGCQPPTDATPPADVTASLVQKKLTVSSSGSTFLYYEGTVDGVCPDSGQLVISADDASESAADLTFPVATGIDVTKVDAGKALTTDAEVGTDGTTTLSGVTSDDGAK